MKKIIVVKLTVKDPETGVVVEYEVDSQSSQETELDNLKNILEK